MAMSARSRKVWYMLRKFKVVVSYKSTLGKKICKYNINWRFGWLFPLIIRRLGYDLTQLGWTFWSSACYCQKLSLNKFDRYQQLGTTSKILNEFWNELTYSRWHAALAICGLTFYCFAWNLLFLNIPWIFFKLSLSLSQKRLPQSYVCFAYTFVERSIRKERMPCKRKRSK